MAYKRRPADAMTEKALNQWEENGWLVAHIIPGWVEATGGDHVYHPPEFVMHLND